MRVTSTRLSGMGGKCSVPRLGDVRLCLSSGSPGAEGHQEDPGGGLSHNSDSSVVTKSTLVPRDIRITCGHPTNPAGEGRSPVTPVSTSQRQTSRHSRNVDIGYLETVKTAWFERGLSEQVASRTAGSKESLSRQLMTQNFVFACTCIIKWCRQKSVGPLQASVVWIGRFLEFLFQRTSGPIYFWV